MDIGKKLNGTVSVGDVELSFFGTFPKVSVLLRKVSITDSMFAQHHHAFFVGEEVYAKLSVMRLIKKQSAVTGLKIEKAAIYLFTDTSGYTNTYLFKSKKDTSSGKDTITSKKSELNSVTLGDVRITIDDKLKGKLHDIVINHLDLKLDDEDAKTIFSANAKMLVHSLAFNIAAGSFIKEKKFEGISISDMIRN